MAISRKSNKRTPRERCDTSPIDLLCRFWTTIRGRYIPARGIRLRSADYSQWLHLTRRRGGTQPMSLMRPKVARACTATAIVLAGWLTAACTSSSDNSTSTSTPAPTTASSASAPSSTPEPSQSSTTRSTTSGASPATSTSPPWPADFTPEQQADAQAAITAYINALRVTDEAYSDPSRPDLETFIRQYIADPRASQVLQAASSMVANGEHSTGYSSAEVQATGVEGNMVSLTVCVDSSGKDLLDSQGESIRAQLPVGDRIKQTANVYKYSEENGGWLLSELNTPQPYEPC